MDTTKANSHRGLQGAARDGGAAPDGAAGDPGVLSERVRPTGPARTPTNPPVKAETHPIASALLCGLGGSHSHLSYDISGAQIVADTLARSGE